jgi:hypothetical protein
MKYDQLAYDLQHYNGPRLGMKLATFWVSLWRACRKTLSAPFRLVHYLYTASYHTWLERLLTTFWWGFMAAIGWGLADLLNGDPALLRTVVLVWTVPCMLFYSFTEWWNIVDYEEDDD